MIFIELSYKNNNLHIYYIMLELKSKKIKRNEFTNETSRF